MSEYPVANPLIHQRARDVLALNPLFLDTETTGTGPRDLIIEVGIVDAQGNELFNSLVNPGIPIPPESSAVHGINDHDVAGEPKWPQVWPQVEALLNGRAIGIYNADFDLRLLRQSNVANHLPWTLRAEQAFCMMKMFAAWYGEWNPRYNGFRAQKLEYAGRLCGLREQNTHHAIDDARLTAELLRYLASQ